jgi:hypothetical protein
MKRNIDEYDIERGIIQEYYDGIRSLKDLEDPNKKPPSVSLLTLLFRHKDFRQWFDAQVDPNSQFLKHLMRLDSDTMLQIAVRSPKGFVNSAKTSKESFAMMVKPHPAIFYEICVICFPDVIAEFYIATEVHKLASLLKEKENERMKDLRVKRYRNPDILTLEGPSKILNGYRKFQKDNVYYNIPSLELYTQVDASFIDTKLLRLCRKNPTIRRNVHELFKIVYPLRLPHIEYCYTLDVLLLIRVWELDFVLNRLLKSFESRAQEASGLEKCEVNIKEYFTAFVTIPSENIFLVWDMLCNRARFEGFATFDESPYMQKLETDFENDTKKTLPGLDGLPYKYSQVTKGPVIKNKHKDYTTHRYSDLKKIQYANALIRHERFKNIMNHRSLIKFAEIQTKMIYDMRPLNDEDDVLIYPSFYYEWLERTQNDLENFPEEELFKDSALKNTMKFGDIFKRGMVCNIMEFLPKGESVPKKQPFVSEKPLFEDDDSSSSLEDEKRREDSYNNESSNENSSLDESNENSSVDESSNEYSSSEDESSNENSSSNEYSSSEDESSNENSSNDESSNDISEENSSSTSSNNENLSEEEEKVVIIEDDELWQPYDECDNWMHVLSKRVEYIDLTPDQELYKFGSLTVNTSQTLSCDLCKKIVNKDSKTIDPWFGKVLCNEICHQQWYKSNGLI